MRYDRARTSLDRHATYIVAARTVMAQSAAAQAAAAAAAMEQQRRFRRSLERRRFTRWHEWVTIDDGIATVGITGYAIERLGQIVHVSLPAAGILVNAGARSLAVIGAFSWSPVGAS